MRIKMILVLSCAWSAAACTTLPDVTASYRLPRADMTLTVTETLGCSPAPGGGGAGAPVSPPAPSPPRTLYRTTAVVPDVQYSADTDPTALVPVRIANLDSPVSDADITLEYYSDGRLKGVNSTSTGQGTAVVQAIATVVPAVLALSSESLDKDGDAALPIDEDQVCRAIDAAAGAGKTVSIIYELTEDFAPVPLQATEDFDTTQCINAQPRGLSAPTPSRNCTVAPMRPIPLSSRETRLSDVVAGLPVFCAHFELDPSIQRPLMQWNSESARNAVSLRLRNPLRYAVTVFEVAPGATCSAAVRQENAVWDGAVHIPLTNAASMVMFGTPGTYLLPVPRGRVFGANQIKLAVAESGAVTTLGYGNTSGTAAAIGAVGAIAGAATDTASERAARYQSQADLIKQQQRLIACRQNREDCE